MATICQIWFIILLTLTTRSEFMASSPSISLKRLCSLLCFYGCTLSVTRPSDLQNVGCFLVSSVFSSFFPGCLNLTLATSKLGTGME